jgi:hypothetical protein
MILIAYDGSTSADRARRLVDAGVRIARAMGFRSFLEGSVSRHVGTHAHAPVLVVPPGPGA